MMTTKFLHTSELARAVGIHPNTVRRYEDWGLLPPVARSPAGYRLFTQQHLDCLRLARLIYAAEYPGRALRAAGNEVIQCAIKGDWRAALEKAQTYFLSVTTELERANQAANLLEHWAQNEQAETDEAPLAIGEVSRLLDASLDVIRNWERDGLISVRRNPYNGYRLFQKKGIERLQIIRMLGHSGYSHMAILRMFIELDGGNRRDLKKVLDTPRQDEDIFTAADHWLTTLSGQEKLARQVIQLVEKQIASGEG
jgi:DNA-binding transcriptional MerR regulator